MVCVVPAQYLGAEVWNGVVVFCFSRVTATLGLGSVLKKIHSSYALSFEREKALY